MVDGSDFLFSKNCEIKLSFFQHNRYYNYCGRIEEITVQLNKECLILVDFLLSQEAKSLLEVSTSVEISNK